MAHFESRDQLLNHIRYIGTLENIVADGKIAYYQVPDVVIQKALAFAQQIDPLPEVFPTMRGTLQLEWSYNNTYVELEFYEDRISFYTEPEENTARTGGMK